MDITTPGAQPTSLQMQAYMKDWMAWINGIAEKGQLASGGNHFSREGRVLQSNREQIESPHISENNSVAGYIIVRAKDLDDATVLARKCPILHGDNTSVEIRELGVPG